MEHVESADAPALPAGLVAAILARPARLRGVRLVTIDGPAGSGKTTLAAALADALRAREVRVETVHLDDLYEGWDGLDERLTGRLAAWLVGPLRVGEPVRHRVYDWQAGQFGGWREVPFAEVLLVDGAGAGQPVLAGVASLRIWVEAPPATCRQRGLARGGVGVVEHWDAWSRREAEHFAVSQARAGADVLVSTG